MPPNSRFIFFKFPLAEPPSHTCAGRREDIRGIFEFQANLPALRDYLNQVSQVVVFHISRFWKI